MQFRIYFEWPDGTSDDICISGDTIEEVRAKVGTAMAEREATYIFSEELK